MLFSFSWQAQRTPDFLEMVQEFVSENYIALGVGAVTIASIAAVTYILSVSHKPIKPVVDVNNQSVVIDGKPYHRASRLAKGPDYFTFDRSTPNTHTVYQVLELGKDISNNGPCLGERSGPNREYRWLSYQQVIDKALQFGSGLIFKELAAANDTFVGIYASNRPEWTISDFGCQAYSMCPVPLYDTLGAEGCKYILNQCEIRAVVTDTEEKVQSLIDMKSQIPTLKLVVIVGHLNTELKVLALKKGVEVIQFQDLLDLGKRHLKKPLPPKPSDLFSVMYTSGTTGNPKGAMLTHHSYITMVDSVIVHQRQHMEIKCGDVHLSYLPLAHTFDRTMCVMMLMRGAQIGYFSRDITLLMDDLSALKPTIFPSVPRLLNRIYDSVCMATLWLCIHYRSIILAIKQLYDSVHTSAL